MLLIRIKPPQPLLASLPVLVRTYLAGFLFVLFAAAASSTLHASDLDLNLTPDAAQSLSESGQRYAIVVGVNQYRDFDNQLTPLLYAKNDARLLASTFRKNGYSVVELVDFAADKNHILDIIANIGSLDTGNNTLVFAFSGHGFQQDGINYLAMGNTDTTRPERTALSVKQLKHAMAQTGVAQRVLLLDACRNGLGKGLSGIEQRFALDSSDDGAAVMYSTAAGELSFEDNVSQQGVFSKFVAEGLNGGAGNGFGDVTFDTLFDFVSPRVKNRVLELNGRAQVPYIAGERSGDFVLMSVDNAESAGLDNSSVVNLGDKDGAFPKPEIRSNRWRNVGIALGILAVGALLASSGDSSGSGDSPGNVTLVLPTP